MLHSVIHTYGILLLAFSYNTVTLCKSSIAITHQARLVIGWTGVGEQVCVLKIPNSMQPVGLPVMRVTITIKIIWQQKRIVPPIYPKPDAR